MLIDAEMDHGPILAQAKQPVADDETGGSLHDSLAKLGAAALPNVLADYLDGKIQPREQDHPAATYCKMLSRDDGRLDFTKTAAELARLVRAYHPWPGTWTTPNDKRLKIIEATAGDADHVRKPGESFVHHGTLCFACADGTALEIKLLQPESKRPMSTQEYLAGRK
jgi:methionyl-tRNA formyltransferase